PSSASLFEVVNRTDFKQDFKAFFVQLNRRFSNAWQGQVSYTWQDSQAYATGTVTGSTQQDFSSLSSTAGFGRTPNDLINAYGPTPTNSTNSWKLSSTYRAPRDVTFGVRYSYESGRPFGRLITARLNQGNVTILAEPRGAYYMDSVNDLQLRVDKGFRLGSTRTVRLSLDMFNIFDSGTVLTVLNNSTTQGDAGFAQTTAVARRRPSRMGAGYHFWRCPRAGTTGGCYDAFRNPRSAPLPASARRGVVRASARLAEASGTRRRQGCRRPLAGRKACATSGRVRFLKRRHQVLRKEELVRRFKTISCAGVWVGPAAVDGL